jgi:aminoglycoside 6'-N-acetyltransferase I
MKRVVNAQFVLLTEENMSTVVPLYCRVFNAAPWNDGWTDAVARERLKTFGKFPNFLGAAMMDGAEVIGFALGWAERWVDSWQFHLYEMCIDSKLQGQGYGRKLMLELERLATERAYTAVFLKTAENAPAKHFYEACNYRQRNMIVMGKRLV